MCEAEVFLYIFTWIFKMHLSVSAIYAIWIWPFRLIKRISKKTNTESALFTLSCLFNSSRFLDGLVFFNTIDPSKKQITMTLDNWLHKKCICEAQIINNFTILNMFFCFFLKSYKSFVMIMKHLLEMTLCVNVKCISVNYLHFFMQALFGPNKRVFIKDKYDLITLDKLPRWVQEKCSCADYRWASWHESDSSTLQRPTRNTPKS